MSLFIFFSIGSVLGGCASDVPAEQNSSRVRAYSVPEGVKSYSGAQISAGGTVLPAYEVMVNTSQNWVGDGYQRKANGVCLFELDGEAEITVKPEVKVDYKSVVRPLSAKITPIANLQENTLTFTVKSAGEYVLEINGDIHNAIHFFVSSYGGAVTDYSGYDNVMVFEAGLHTFENDDRISPKDNRISIGSNTLVYLADGAVVRGCFHESNLSNVAIVGRGIIDGSAFERSVSRGKVTVPIEFNYSTNVLLKDFFILDPAGWAITNYFCEGSKISNLKIISSRSNGDGVSLQSCKNVEVEGCFVRTWDDSLVVKNYPRWENRNIHGETDGISFKNCTLWTDLAQSMEVGYETVGIPMENISFENITVLHALHNAAISIHNANNAEIKNVTFKNITVEDGKNAADGVGLIDLRVLYSSNWSDQHTAPTALGSVDGVLIENLNVISARRITALMGGCRDTRVGFESEHYVDNVTIKNVALAGTRPQESECKFSTTDAKYLRNFSFVQEDVAVTGAEFVFTQSEEYLSALEGCKVEIIN